MKKNSRNKIIEILEEVGKIIENFREFGATEFIFSWTKDIKSWAEEHHDKELLKLVVSFSRWKDKEALRKLIEKVEDRYQNYLDIVTTENNVFIAHNDGDPFAKELEAFLFKEKFHPIIMQKQPNKGQTIIDKFKSLTFNIAIILLIEDPQLTNKANISLTKQNVILEAGYCYAYLKDVSKIIIMHDGKVMIPSNIGAIEYIKIDENWKYNLLKAFEARGLIEKDQNLN